MKVDMSPEAVTNRLQTMEQLWELSVNLMQAREISETILTSGKDQDESAETDARKSLNEPSPAE